MSAPAGLPTATADLVGDPGVLRTVPTLEFQGYAASAVTGGCAVLPWRAHQRAALALGLRCLPSCQTASPPKDAAGEPFTQAVVRIGKGRAATTADLAQAWAALAPAGRLLIVGTNDTGIVTWAKRLAEWTGAPGEVLVNRARGRVVAFERTAARTAAMIPEPLSTVVPLPDGTGLEVAPGVFSADGLDGGTALLLQVLAEEPPTSTIVDVGCGAGHLGLAAARQFPASRVWLLDADYRAIQCATRNAAALAPGAPGAPGDNSRVQTCWWDEHDAWPAPQADLALVNPPCHAGTASDVSAAHRLFAVTDARRLLVVANRHLPYEHAARALGALRVRADDGRFKVLEISR